MMTYNEAVTASNSNGRAIFEVRTDGQVLAREIPPVDRSN